MPNSNQAESKKFTRGMWKLMMIRGIFLVVVGLILLLFPKGTLTTLVFILGIYWLIDGIVTIINAAQRSKIYSKWWWGLITGGFSILAGLIVLFKPLSSTVFTTSFLMWLLGIVAIINGISGLITGIKLNKMQHGAPSIIWGGMFSIVLGIILISAPFTTALVIIKVLGSFTIFAGLITVLFANKIKNKAKR
jgi:uncharacterized membrane protein HdeD (DUF308 family)